MGDAMPTVTMPSNVIERLRARAAAAGLFDRAGVPNVAALRDSLFDALRAGGCTVQEAIHAVATDAADPDMAAFTRASADVLAAAGPRWRADLAERIDLDPGTVFRLRRRAEGMALPGLSPVDFATMASMELAQFLNGVKETDASVARCIAEHPEPAMRELFRALEQARAAARPN